MSAVGRVAAAMAPTMPMSANRTRPAGDLRCSASPAQAANAAMIKAMSTNRAGLSEVPKVEMANSRAPSGARSMTAPPTAVRGAEPLSTRGARRYPTPTPKAAPSIPASAAAAAPWREVKDMRSSIRAGGAGGLIG
jgi:hypothetical protein